MSIGQACYSALTWAGEPWVHVLLGWREDRGKEDPERLHERFGYSSLDRPAGKLVWLHAASVGEAMSILLLLGKLAARFPQTHFLLTSGTVTSARLLDSRLPANAMHQYVPVDIPTAVQRFLAHWRPDMVLWVESELWPNLLAGLRERNIPAALLNARLSQKSQRNWRLARAWLREMLGTFSLCLCQTEEAQPLLTALGAKNAGYVGNLKFAALPLPDDAFGREQLVAALAGRPAWLFASSHPGEDALAITAHQQLRAVLPGLVTIIVPRHPVRGAAIKELGVKAGMHSAQRSLGEKLTADTELYIADTLGELGLFYRLCPVTVVGGSFVPVGGHNPIEPALLNCAIAFGPLMTNFAEVAPAMVATGAARQVSDPISIAAFVQAMHSDPAAQQRLQETALAFAQAQGSVHDKVMTQLQPLFDQAGLS